MSRDARRAERYMERKLAGLCTQCGVPAAPDVQQCEVHIAKAREATREAAVRRRAQFRLEGVCANGCGTKSQRYYCAACTVKIARFPSHSVNVGVNVRPSDEYRTRKHADGRTRYHGQMVRGRQPTAQLDDQDITHAIEALQKARSALAYVASPAVQELPRIQREAAKREALSQADHGQRFIEDLLDRNRYASGMQLTDPATARRRVIQQSKKR